MKIGDIVDRYQVVEKIGVGGMAEVYGVRHVTLHTEHALKVMTLEGRSTRERLVQEGRLQAQLQHENLVGVTDVFEVEGMPALLLEYVDGPPLDLWLASYQPTLDEALSVFRGILAGMGYAHERGIIHRDLKPGNVMLARDDDGAFYAKVMDFGLAKSFVKKQRQGRTRAGAVMGTPSYMPPEQIRDASTVDRRADIYSLGCLLYELILGRQAFDEPDLIELFQKIKQSDYVSPRSLQPDLPTPVVDAIDGMMSAERTLRLSDVAAVAEVLSGAAERQSITEVASRRNAEGLAAPRPTPRLDPRHVRSDSPAAQAALRMIRRPMPSLSDLPVAVVVPRAAPETLVSPEVVVGAPDADPIPTTSRRWMASAAFFTGTTIVFGGLLGVLGLGGLLWWTMDVAEPENLAPPDPLDPVPIQSPRLDEPKPEPAVDPAPEPSPKPKPTAPVPVNQPDPVPTQAPSVAPSTPPAVAPSFVPGRFSLVNSDDAVVSVRIRNKTGSYSANQDAPPGTYAIVLSTKELGSLVYPGAVVLQEGGRVTLQCSGSQGLCRVR